jgi:predicted anti-sigma-YlaC factor YlaD
MNLSSHANGCQLEDVAAYLDGELSGETLRNFEAHLKACRECAGELRIQRQLLCTLDAAFNDSNSFKLPHDFTRVVTAHAESDLSGMRRKGERRRALQVCAVLALVSFALLGAAARVLVLEPAQSFLRLAGIFFDLVWRMSYDAGTGLAVIVRVVGRAIAFGPYGLGLVVLPGFILSISLLSLLIARYHRAQIIE